MNAAIVISWLPLATLPAFVVVFAPSDWPRWGFMWVLAGAIFVGCKWLTWRTTPATGVSAGRQFGYLALWPGLDAGAFLHAPNRRVPDASEWWFAGGKLFFGAMLTAFVVPRISPHRELARGWAGMIGMVFLLHFGSFHLLSLAWRTRGITARPIMYWPILATSVSDFWGRRWNTAFRDLTHRYLFRPLAARMNATAALVAGFVVSGLVHELVITVPAGAAHGGPTAFFLIQTGAIVLERSSPGRRLGLTRGPRGRAFTMLVLLAPLPLLFPPPFVRGVIVPFLDWVSDCASSAS